MRTLLTICLFAVLFTLSCRPKPIAIDVAQEAERIAIASTALDEHTVIVAISYSITSLFNLDDTDRGQTPVSLTNVLVDSALVTIADGARIDTLSKISAGLYRNTTLSLVSGRTYLLAVLDYRTGLAVHAATTYQSALTVDTVRPLVDRRVRDTAVQLVLSLRDNRPGQDYYIVAYDNINPSTIPSAIGSPEFAILNADEAKQVEVFSDAEAMAGRISKTFNIDVSPGDTLFVQYGRIDKGYYDFLASYKRSGSIITQAVAEPVTLPSNVINGLGYFSLYDARREVFAIRNY